MFIRKITAFILFGASILFCCSFETGAAEISMSAPETSAVSAILICSEGNRVLYEKNADQRLPIASITKIMTAVIALEYAAKDDKLITFDNSMSAEGSSLYLEYGDRLRLSELVKGMLCVSGNDAANAVAIGIAGSIEAFSELMNNKASELGMMNTHFVTPSGLDAEGHYSTARDMAVLCSYAMKSPVFADIVSRKNLEVSFEYPENKKRSCVNHNRLLSEYEGCTGIKTGYTDKAGRTLTSCVRRNGTDLIAVTLNDRNDWADHKALFDYGFSRCTRLRAAAREQCFSLPVVGGDSDEITVSPETDCFCTGIRGEESRLEYKLVMPHFVYAPINKGEVTGSLCCYLDGRRIAVVPLRAAMSVETEKGEK